MKILLLGAAFDPPHLGHMKMASQVVEWEIADKVILVPCGSHAFSKNMSEAEHRFKMTEMVVEELEASNRGHFELSKIEIERVGVSYAIDTLIQMAQVHPESEVGWLMGSDQLIDFNRWARYEEILEKFPVYVYPRKGYGFEAIMPGMISLERMPMVEISSSLVRQSVEAGRDISEMVTPGVKKYIIEHKLWIK